MPIYDPRSMTWDQWCRLQCEQFAAQQLQVVPESSWRAWADSLQGLGNFSAQGVPDSRGFNSWREWALRFVDIMSFSQAPL